MNRVVDLDLVKSNSDVTFPPNVTLNFVYWQHTRDNLPYLVPHLQTADGVAWETAGIYASEGHTKGAAGKYVEKATNHVIQGIATDEEQDFLNGYAGIVVGKANLLRILPKRPRFFMVDDFAGRTEEHNMYDDRLHAHSVYAGEDYLRDEVKSMEYMVVREDKALNQLAAISTRLGRSGQEKELAVVYGAFHTPLSVAVRGLGANVKRSFVHRPRIDHVATAVARLIRFDLLPPLDEMEPEEIKVILAAIEVDAALMHKRATNGPLQSAATILKTVCDLDVSSRDELERKAAEINDFRRRKLVREKPYNKLTWLAKFPAAYRFTTQSESLKDDFLAAVKQNETRAA